MKQPKALRILFFTEMWERFGFYATQTLLVFYLINRLSFSDADAYAVLGQVTALIYLGPVLGGWACDRFLGCRFAVLLGGFFLCLGYAIMALDNHTLFTGLSCVVLGNSLLKPNISSFLGQFYTDTDSRRDAGFTLFYVGINIGVILATTSTGYIQQTAGWGASFGAASFALILGIAVFRWGYRYFQDKGLPPVEHAQTLSIFLRKRPTLVLWFCGALTVIYYSMTTLGLGSYGVYLCGLLFCVYVVYISFKLKTIERKRMLTLLVLFLLATAFWTLWFQIFFAVNVFTDRAVDRMLWGHLIPTSVFVGLDSFFVLLSGPLLAIVWKKINLSVPTKYAAGLLLTCISMQLLAWSIADSTTTTSLLNIVLFYFGIVMGEMLIVPIGMSMVTEYTPKQYTSLMMGGFLMSLSFGGKLSGILAGYADVPKGITDITTLNHIYNDAFQSYAYLGFGVLLLFLPFVPLLKKWLHG